MRPIGLIRAGWLKYAEMVLPPNSSRIQRDEARKSFYAGAGLLFEALTNAVGPDDVSEDAGLEIMESVDAEIKAFLRDVKAGKR